MLKNILLVDDEIITRTAMSGYFEKNGYRVHQASDGTQMYQILEEEKINLVILDINLPTEDGFHLTRQLRSQSDVGIIIVTDKNESIDRIVGLEMGADDYFAKPVCLRELLVRVKNLLWRLSSYQKFEKLHIPAKDILHFNGWVFDTNRRTLNNEHKSVILTKAEYELLLAFAMNPNRVLNRDRILNLLTHRIDAPNDRIVDVLVRRLRNKIESEPKNPQLFITVHGEGYMFTGL